MTVPIVSVNGREITAAAIAAEAQHHPAGTAQEAWEAAAEALVIRQLLLDEADRLGIVAAQTQDGDGQTLAQEDALIDALLAAEVHVPTADTATCRRYYDSHAERFQSPILVEASHILIAADPSDSLAYGLATGDARMLIRALQAEPERFAELAQARSACPSKEQGGNLGQIGPGDTVEPFEAALFALEEGALCPDPVKTRFGIHVIRAGRRVEGESVPFEAVEEQIAAYLEEASYRRAVSQYLSLLAGKARLEGVFIGAADGALVQ
jgi:peptidyl-prolyl cis-trans isomerase C